MFKKFCGIALGILAGFWLIGASSATAGQAAYAYDNLGRLISVSHSDGFVVTATSFSYDAGGNRTQADITRRMADADGDLMPDGWELQRGLNPEDPGDAPGDPDGDGLTNQREYTSGTNPWAGDTDGDGHADGAEVAAGSNPLDSGSVPPPTVAVPALHPLGLAALALLLAALGSRLRSRRAGGVLLLPLLLALSTPASADYYWVDNWSGQQWSSPENACWEGEIHARVAYLDAHYSADAPHYSQGISDPDNAAQSYCGWSIYHFQYIPGYGNRQVTDTYGSIVHDRQGLGGKEKGCGNCAQPSTKVGNPCDAFTGNKFASEVDFSLGGMGFEFRRDYNSLDAAGSALGLGWRHGFEQEIVSLGASHVQLRLGSGKVLEFALVGSQWLGDPDVTAKLTKDAGGWVFTTANDVKYHFNLASGLQDWRENPAGYRLEMEYGGRQLSLVRDNLGNTLEFAYTPGGFLQQVRHVESDKTWQYQQDAQNRLVGVDHPDGTHTLYHYEDARFPHALTGITDRRGVRFATYAYDEHGLAVSTEHAGGAGRRVIDFDAIAENFPGVTDSLGRVQYFGGAFKWGTPRVESQSYDGDGSIYTYNAKNQLTERNRNGRVTQYGSYDTKNNPRYVIEAAGTPQARRTDYVFDSRFFRKPTSISVPSVAAGKSRVTAIAYDAQANPNSVGVSGFKPDGTAIQASTTFAHDGPLHQLSRIDGPRADVSDTTLYRYYPDNAAEGFNRARLKEIELANGALARSNIQYSATGQVLGENRPNGLTLAYAYHPGSDRLQRITETGGGVSRATAFTYLATGEVQTVTTAAGTDQASTLTFAYDDARRLIRVTNQAGEYIHYTLNTEGDRIREEYHAADGSLTRHGDFEHNAKGQVTKAILPGTDVEEAYAYDGTGNLLSRLNALDELSSYSYDGLSRLVSSTRDAASPAVTAFAYDARDNPASVTAPNALVTTFASDDLGRRVSETSPDTGTTTYAHDAAGNLVSRTDAGGRTSSYAYDALNRLVSVTFSDTAQNVGYAYDQGVNGLGRLTGVSDGAGSTGYQYNAFGQVLKETRTTGGRAYETAYAYSPATGRLESLTYPSGLVLTIQRDAAGRVATLLADGSPVVTGVGYLPFGPVRSLTAGNVTETRTFDARYTLTRIQRGGADLQFTRDKLGRVSSLSGLQAPDLSVAAAGYTLATGSNRLEAQTGPTPRQYTHDANGNIVFDGIRTFAYDHRNRLVRVEQGGQAIATYAYDARNRRVAKTTSAGTTHFHYDLDGRLLGESLSDGTPLRDYIYLGDEPIALKLYGAQAGMYYFVNDHLGTPRQVVDASGAVVWKAAYLPFGEVQVSVETIKNNVRFPGQYFDAETGLHYNWNRYYDPATGRYISADPIGLEGGLNLYGYVDGDPVNEVDLYGLQGGAPAIPGIPMLPPILPPVFTPGTPENDAFVKDVTHIINYLSDQLRKPLLNEDAEEADGDCCNDAQAPGQPTEEDGFVPPKNWDGKKVNAPGGKGYGWPDRKGNVWVPTGPTGHGGPHWDVQGKKGGYINVYPGGTTRP